MELYAGGTKENMNGREGAWSKKNLRGGEVRVAGRGGKEGERKLGVVGEQTRSPASIYGGCAGVGARQEMEEIRENTAELDKPADFVLSGVRNANRRHRVVGGRRPDDPSRVPLNFRSADRPAACRFTRKSAICYAETAARVVNERRRIDARSKRLAA